MFQLTGIVGPRVKGEYDSESEDGAEDWILNDESDDDLSHLMVFLYLVFQKSFKNIFFI